MPNTRGSKAAVSGVDTPESGTARHHDLAHPSSKRPGIGLAALIRRTAVWIVSYQCRLESVLVLTALQLFFRGSTALAWEKSTGRRSMMGLRQLFKASALDLSLKREREREGERLEE
jgi:hypothetical protein